MHIQSASPAKNAGEAFAADVAGTLDIDGQARVQDGIIDIGADEFGSTTILSQHKISQRRPAGIFSTERSIIIYGIDPAILTTVRIFSMDGRYVKTVTEKNNKGLMVIGNEGLAAGHYWVKASSGEKLLTGMAEVCK
jgi:hypothetical protein